MQFPKDLPVTFADVADLGRLVPSDAPHQGVVIEAEPLEEVWLDDLLQGAGDHAKRSLPVCQYETGELKSLIQQILTGFRTNHAATSTCLSLIRQKHFAANRALGRLALNVTQNKTLPSY